MDAHIMHHVQNSFEWVIPFAGPMALPQFLSLHALMLILSTFFLILLTCVIGQSRGRVPHRAANLLEVFVIFIRDSISKECLGHEDGIKMTPFFCTMFFFILTMNLLGLIPLFSSASANINVTGALAFSILLLMVIGGIRKNGVKSFFTSFVPSGVPMLIMPLIVPLEIIMFFMKVIVLAMRLFLNMLAGHLIILSMLGVIVVLGLKASPIFLLVVMMYALEIFVAFLQAYVFTFLSAVFIGQMYHPQH